MRSARVYRNAIFAGIISEEEDNTYKFEYDSTYFNMDQHPAISLTMPKIKQEYVSDYLFPFFFNMLAEGVNRKVQLRHLQISEMDHFGLLLATSSLDTIGPIRVEEIKAND